jgi:hypothetical protein
MENQSIQEYKLVREEMTRLKDCLTNYVGFALGGSGAAIMGITSFRDLWSEIIGMPFVALILSLLVSMVLLIIFYKFNSHNRFAGYCKLLSYERFVMYPANLATQIFSWEICLGQLRRTEINPAEFRNIIHSIICHKPTKSQMERKLEEHTGPQINFKNLCRGFRYLVFAPFGQPKANSWGFPPLVTSVFFLLSTFFLGLGLFGILRPFRDMGLFEIAMAFPAEGLSEIVIVFFNSMDFGKCLFLISIGAFLIFGVIILWSMFCCKLRLLMEGSIMIDAFFWRFLPIRIEFLNSNNIIPEYINIK